jgi:hypothetical protein
MELIQGKGDKQLSKQTSSDMMKSDSKPREVTEETKMMADVAKLNSLSIRFNKFKALLEVPNVDIGIFPSKYQSN